MSHSIKNIAVLGFLSACVWLQPPATHAAAASVEEPSDSVELERESGQADRTRPELDAFLVAGNLDDAHAAFSTYLESHPQDDHARAGLGVIQFMTAIENFGQSLHRFGAKPPSSMFLLGNGVPLFRMPVPLNPQPEVVRYEDVRTTLGQLVEDLSHCEETLGLIEDAGIKLELRLGIYRLDLDGDGESHDNESLWSVYRSFNAAAARVSPRDVEEFYIAADRADFHWLRGYCHLISAMAETLLAYDFRETFETTAHAFFQSPESESAFLGDLTGISATILDEFAIAHTVRWELIDPDRMRKAHHHLLMVIRESRLTWDSILKEMDNDHEWIPNPDQTGVVPRARITQEMADQWLLFVDEAEALLQGELLIPFWMSADVEQGVNLRRVFMEPSDLDALLWVAGTGAIEYLEDGELSEPETWAQFQRVFQGQFIGFVFWFN